MLLIDVQSDKYVHIVKYIFRAVGGRGKIKSMVEMSIMVI